MVNNLISCLEGLDVGVDPRRLRVGDLFDDVANERVAKVLTHMIWEILDPRIGFCTFGVPQTPTHPCEGKSWERVVLKLGGGDLVDGGVMGKMTYV